jgi:hypothetical protein
MNLSVLRPSWPRFDAPAQEGFDARPAALHGADDIGEPEGLAALRTDVAVVAAVQVQGLDIEGSRRIGILHRALLLHSRTHIAALGRTARDPARSLSILGITGHAELVGLR